MNDTNCIEIEQRRRIWIGHLIKCRNILSLEKSLPGNFRGKENKCRLRETWESTKKRFRQIKDLGWNSKTKGKGQADVEIY
jgi:hypothetical protein